MLKFIQSTASRPFVAAALIGAVMAGSPLMESPSKAGELLKSGTFVGQSKHVTTGSVRIERDGDRTLVILGADFSLDGAPAPTLGFTKNGTFDKATEFAKLKALTGKQFYEISDKIDVSAYDTCTVWCAKFSVPLGSAALKP